MSQISRASRYFTIAAFLLGSALAQPAAAASIGFTFSTFGCFASTTCTPTLGSLEAHHIIFDGVVDETASVDPNTSNVADVSLGSFALDGNANPGGDTVFDLLVQFAAPTSAGNNLFGATLTGKVNGAGDSIVVEFLQTLHPFTFTTPGGAGGFELYVTNNPVLTSTSGTVGLTGRIQNVTFSLDENRAAATAPVPEPASLLLLGAGLIGVSLRGRRKKS